MNRKVKEFCIKHRWRLPRIGYTWKLSFREDLEPSNAEVVEMCEVLMKSNQIKKYTINNGFVNVHLDGKGIKIFHPVDLRSIFPDFFETYYDPT